MKEKRAGTVFKNDYFKHKNIAKYFCMMYGQICRFLFISNMSFIAFLFLMSNKLK